MEKICKRCGCCCYLIINGQPSNIKCKHLVILSSGKTLCRIYNKRLGQAIGFGNYCTKRENVKINYPECDWNEGENNENNR